MRTIIVILALAWLLSCNQSKVKETGLIIKDQKGKHVEINELGDSGSTYTWEFLGDMEIPIEADKLHKQAREYGSSGQYEKAISNLKKAHELAPSWPYPVYDLGFTYLLMLNYTEALKYYEKTVELAPKGFFTSKTAYWCLKKESEGEFPEGLYLNYLQIEWAPSDAARIELAEQIVNKFPKYTPAWNILGSNQPDNFKRMEAINQGLELDSDIDTRANLFINQAIVLNENGRSNEASQILEEIVNSKDYSIAHIEQARITLNFMGNK